MILSRDSGFRSTFLIPIIGIYLRQWNRWKTFLDGDSIWWSIPNWPMLTAQNWPLLSFYTLQNQLPASWQIIGFMSWEMSENLSQKLSYLMFEVWYILSYFIAWWYTQKYLMNSGHKWDKLPVRIDKKVSFMISWVFDYSSFLSHYRSFSV